MKPEEKALAKFRAGIDTIDDEMLRLIGKRLVRAKNLRAMKPANRAAWAPDREHALFQRLLNQRPENLPPETLISMWSALIAASLMAQGPFDLFCANDQMKELARAGFPCAPIHDVLATNWRKTIYDTPGAIGIFPFPNAQENWWCDLAKPGPNIYVQTTLPKWPPHPARGVCLSADQPVWQTNQVCWAIGRTEQSAPANAQMIAQNNGFILWQAPRPFDLLLSGEMGLPDGASGLISVGCFFPFLDAGSFDDPIADTAPRTT